MTQPIIVPSEEKTPAHRTGNPSTLVFSGWHEVPVGYEPARKWDWQFGRKVKFGERPKAIVRWTVESVINGETHHPDGMVTHYERPYEKVKEVNLFTFDQTRSYRPNNRTLAVRWFCDVFQRYSSKKFHIKRTKTGWTSIPGKLQPDFVKQHLQQTETFGVRAGFMTQAIGLDLDLHGGDEIVLLNQLDLLLSCLWGSNAPAAGWWGTGPWFLQVAENDANGVHLLSVMRHPVETNWLYPKIRAFLRELDDLRPDLARQARDAGMRTLGESEILPNQQYGLRLPLSHGRTLLLDKPLSKVQFRSRPVVDVERFKTWIEDDDRQHMPQAQVLGYVAGRLNSANSGTKKKSSRSRVSRKEAIPRTPQGPIRMKGQFRRFLVEFWSGQDNPPDSLNLGIRQLSLMAPYYFKNDPDGAIAKIEMMIDQLPDHLFSTRLSEGHRPKVSKVIREDVVDAYRQRNPRSQMKLEKTYDVWKRRGFNPFDKTTWKSRPAGPRWDWSQEEMSEIRIFASLLKTETDVAAELLRRLIHHVATSNRETSIAYVKRVMRSQNIKVGSERDQKAKHVMDRLTNIGWIQLEVVHTPGARARKFKLGSNLMKKYESKLDIRNSEQEDQTNNNITFHSSHQGLLEAPITI